MKNSFFLRLYRHSRAGFIALVIFLILYAIASFKGMDMVLFPLNDMFSKPSTQSGTVMVYAMEKDGRPVRYTGFPYWQKDLMETALQHYAAYLERGQKTSLGVFMEKREYPALLRKRLEPDAEKAFRWPYWYLSYAGQAPSPDSLKIKSYQMSCGVSGFRIIDSAVLYISKNKPHE